jgi:hypothetical protein
VPAVAADLVTLLVLLLLRRYPMTVAGMGMLTSGVFSFVLCR